MADLFVSYSRTDARFVEKVGGQLRAAGISVWVDTEGIDGGERWRTAITQAINGTVAAAVIGPIAIELAQTMNVNPRSMVMGIALASSMAFITPLSHPVNIMVMSSGGYRFRDFVRVGLPMTVIVFAVVMIFLPIFWPL